MALLLHGLTGPGTSLLLTLCSWSLACSVAACAVAKFPVAALETNCASEECAGSANESGECEKTRERERAQSTLSMIRFHLHPWLPNQISLTLLFLRRHKVEQGQHHVRQQGVGHAQPRGVQPAPEVHRL